MTVAEKKLIFIVKSQQASTNGFETFLKNREWAVESTSDLKKALVGILTRPIYCILVTVDHKNSKCLRLPDIIRQTVKIPVILFGESFALPGTKGLRSSTHPYILFPPVSGPAIERMLLKIEKDLVKASEVVGPKKSILDGHGAPSDKDEAVYNSRSGGRNDFNVADIVQIFEGADSATMKSAEAGINQAISGSSSDTVGIGGLNEAEEANQTAKIGNGSLMDQDQFGNQATSAAGNNALGSRSQEGPGNGASSSQTSGPNSSLIFNSDANSSANRLLNEAQKSILIRGAEHALSAAATVKESKKSQTTSKASVCSRINCFEIQTEKFSGFVVVAFGVEADDGVHFNEALRENLANYLRDAGMAISIDDLVALKLNKVSFEDWSLEEAAFLRKSVSNKDEIAIAFFPSSQKLAPLEIVSSTEMFKFELNEIRSDCRMEFDFYLHLPANKKYVRYVTKDGLIEEKQLARLQVGGVEHVYVPKQSQNDITRYRIQNFLNDKIKSYNNKKSA